MSQLLIVEDNKNIQNHLVKKAKEINQGIEVLTTGYAKEALEIAREKKIDVFFP